MKPDQLLEEKREEILSIASEHGARDVRVFGSVARGEADHESDVDFLSKTSSAIPFLSSLLLTWMGAVRLIPQRDLYLQKVQTYSIK